MLFIGASISSSAAVNTTMKFMRSKTMQQIYDTMGEKMYEDGTVERVLGGASIAGVETSYVYLVDKQGIMRYHPTAQGQPVNNSVIARLVEQMASDIKPLTPILPLLC